MFTIISSKTGLLCLLHSSRLLGRSNRVFLVCTHGNLFQSPFINANVLFSSSHSSSNEIVKYTCSHVRLRICFLPNVWCRNIIPIKPKYLKPIWTDFTNSENMSQRDIHNFVCYIILVFVITADLSCWSKSSIQKISLFLRC